jgi:peptidoglycan/LPS O-acetylase OafA/YrhL
MKHRPELDGLRGIAILVVLAAHTGVPGFADGGGGAGVTLFFVLSGFLITSLLLAEKSRYGRVDLRAFYVRRALRLFPALAAALIVVALLAVTGLMPQDARVGVDYRIVLAGVVCYVANWVWVAGQPIGMLSHTWSLAVEEQFYILWPALLLLGLRLGRRWFAMIVLLLIFADIPYRLILDLNGGFAHVFVGTDTRGDALLFGCVLALLERAGMWLQVGWGLPESWRWPPRGRAIRGSAYKSSSFRRQPWPAHWQLPVVRRSSPGGRWRSSAKSATACTYGTAW